MNNLNMRRVLKGRTLRAADGLAPVQPPATPAAPAQPNSLLSNPGYSMINNPGYSMINNPGASLLSHPDTPSASILPAGGAGSPTYTMQGSIPFGQPVTGRSVQQANGGYQEAQRNPKKRPVEPFGLREGGEIHADLGGMWANAKRAVQGLPPETNKEALDRRLARPAPAPVPAAPMPAASAPQTAAPMGSQSVIDNRMKAAGLRHGGTLRTGMGGDVPGTGQGDKIPAKYEPGEFVVSNDMLDAQPELRGHLRGLREQVLAEKGMTPAEADAKALSGGKGLRANDALNLPKFPDLSLDNVGKQPLPKASLVAENEYQLKRVAELNKGAPAPAPRAAPGALPPHVNPFAAGVEEAQALKDSVRGAQGRLMSNKAGGVGGGFIYGNKIPAAPAPAPNTLAAHGNGTYGAPTSSTAAKLAAQTPEEIAHGARMASEAEAAAKAKAVTAATPKATGVKGVIQGTKNATGSVVNGVKSVASGEFLKADVGKVLRGGANLGKSVLKSPFTPVGLSVGAADAAHQGFNIPTEQYRLRAGMDSHGGTAGDLAARGVGVLADFGDAITFGGATRLGNAIAGRGFVPNSAGTEAPAQSVQSAQDGGRYSSAADSQAANPNPYVVAPVQHEAPATVRGADGRQYLPEAVTSADHTRSDQLINSAFANRPRDGSDPERNMNTLRNNAASMDMYNQGLAAKGSGIQVSKDANGQLRLSGSTGPEKMQYTTPDGTPTDDYTKTRQYAEGVGVAKRDKELLATMQHDRLVQEAGSNNAAYSAPAQRQLAQEAISKNQAIEQDKTNALREGHKLDYDKAMAPVLLAQKNQELIRQVLADPSVGGDPAKAAAKLTMAGYGHLAEPLFKTVATLQDQAGKTQSLTKDRWDDMKPQFKTNRASDGTPEGDRMNKELEERAYARLKRTNPEAYKLNDTERAKAIQETVADEELMNAFGEMGPAGFHVAEWLGGNRQTDRTNDIPGKDFFKGASISGRAGNLRGWVSPNLEGGDYTLKTPGGMKDINLGKLSADALARLNDLIKAANKQ